MSSNPLVSLATSADGVEKKARPSSARKSPFWLPKVSPVGADPSGLQETQTRRSLPGEYRYISLLPLLSKAVARVAVTNAMWAPFGVACMRAIGPSLHLVWKGPAQVVPSSMVATHSTASLR